VVTASHTTTVDSTDNRGTPIFAGLTYEALADVRLVVFTRDASGAWIYLGGSPVLPKAGSWETTIWVTPPMPALIRV